MTDSFTKGEERVLNGLAHVWSAFLALPHEHPDDVAEFRAGIHRLQEKVLARPTRRSLPASLKSPT